MVPYRLCEEVGVRQLEILAELAATVQAVDDVDWGRAGDLLERRLWPLLAERGITPVNSHYHSVYYEINGAESSAPAPAQAAL